MTQTARNGRRRIRAHGAGMNNPLPAVPENSPEAASPPGQTAEEYERSLLQLDEKHLWTMLLCIQQRLGTPAEQPADLEQARAITHRLCNVLGRIRMKTELALLKRESNLAGPVQCAGQCGQM